MSDLEQDLRVLLHVKAQDVTVPIEPTRTLVTRARRRQAVTVLTATLSVAALVAGSLVGIRSVLRADPGRHEPAAPPVPHETPEGLSPAAGPRILIATGTDAEAGTWQLYLEPTNDGIGLGFTTENGGGGSGCCLGPLRSDFQLDGYGYGGGDTANITALASEKVVRIVFEAATGERIDGALYPVPDPSLGIPKIALVLVPSTVDLEGQLVAYDAAGTELAREDVGDNPEPPGPTTEIDVVWERLRNARDALQSYAAGHGDSLSKLDDGNVSLKLDPFIRWNDGALADGEVSVRGVARAGGSELTGLSGWTVVLVSATVGPGGSPASVYCIGVNIDDGGGGNFRYGTQDAASFEDCHGGWPELEQ